jgi:hypothetical protein
MLDAVSGGTYAVASYAKESSREVESRKATAMVSAPALDHGLQVVL